jgi:hypothetical protein
MSSNIESDIDTIVSKLENLYITDNNELDKLCEKFSNLIVSCPESKKNKYYEKINNVLNKMLHKKRCIEKYQMNNIKFIF